MIGSAEAVARLVGFYLLVAGLAHILHLFGGVLAVGPAEVRRQVSIVYAEYGPARYAAFILTAGFWPRDDVIEDGDQA